MVTGRQFERYWPRGCKYASWPNYWAYQLLNPCHAWACPFDDCECPGRAVQVRRCQEALKLRVERRAGEMLVEMEKNPGAATQLHDVTALPPKLEELGISRIQSHR